MVTNARAKSIVPRSWHTRIYTIIEQVQTVMITVLCFSSEIQIMDELLIGLSCSGTATGSTSYPYSFYTHWHIFIIFFFFFLSRIFNILDDPMLFLFYELAILVPCSGVCCKGVRLRVARHHHVELWTKPPLCRPSHDANLNFAALNREVTRWARLELQIQAKNCQNLFQKPVQSP